MWTVHPRSSGELFIRLVGIAIVCFGSTISRQESNTTTEHIYRGVIKENAVEGDEVELDVPLNIRSADGQQRDGEICGYTLYKSNTELPFKIVILSDASAGAGAKIVLGEGFRLDHEQVPEYIFEIAANGCTPDTRAEREKVYVEVEDVNEFAPVWSQDSYYAEVVEGRAYDSILQLSATDADGDSKICSYQLLTPDVPFEIDAEGHLRSTATLDSSTKEVYLLEVVAEDCGGLRSNKVIVNVDIKSVCRPGWTGIPDRVEFTPHEARKLLVPSAELETCDDGCNLTHVAVTVKLTTSHIGKGCDRDTYSLQSQRKLCGASDGDIDLLPSPSASTGGARSWTHELPTDDGHESDQIFAFDGRTTALEIPVMTMEPTLGDKFTISTWMKHEEGKDSDEVVPKGAKEHIICHSDGEEMNRHHYSVFVHNCRLVLLLRREPEVGADPNVFRPAEWRWKLPEVCDGMWHHYAISVEFPDVRLYVDGRQFVEVNNNPDIVDDWQLRPAKDVHFTKLVVGACWQGGKQRMGQYFRGYLAGLSILKNRTETDGVIQCLNSCQEKLNLDGIEDMDTGMSVSMNNEMTSIAISGMTLPSVERLLHRIGYVNTRTFPTPGHRPITVETRATCMDGSRLTVDPIKFLVMVLEAEKPIISLSASKTVTTEEGKIVHGEKIFHQLLITARTRTEEAELTSGGADNKAEELTSDNEAASSSHQVTPASSSSIKYKLDSCLVRVSPAMNLEVERIKYPENLVSQLGLEVDVSEDGFVLAGADKLSNYQDVLSELQYVNSRPGDVNHRTFVLSCTELNGRFLSNQLDVTIEIVRSIRLGETPVPAAIKKQVQVIHGPHIDRPQENKEVKKNDAQTMTGVVVVCIVCVGFVALIVVLGVLRIRNTRRHTRDASSVEERQEMEWDHSELTITVNPMDQESEMYDGGADRVVKSGLVRDDSDSGEEDEEEEEETVYHDNAGAEGRSCSEDEEEEDEAEAAEPTRKLKSRELEWDDSTLSY